jgi:hypothetical protein
LEQMALQANDGYPQRDVPAAKIHKAVPATLQRLMPDSDVWRPDGEQGPGLGDITGSLEEGKAADIVL